MNKEVFLSALKNALGSLPRKERKKTLDFYSEMINDRLEEGLSEEAIFSEIGTPEAIAAQVLSELPKKPRKKISVWVIVLLILGAPLWLPLLIAAAAVVMAVLISLFAIELSLALCGVAGVLGGLILLLLWKPLAALALIGPGLVCLGLAIPFFFLCLWITKALWRWITTLFRKECRS